MTYGVLNRRTTTHWLLASIAITALGLLPSGARADAPAKYRLADLKALESAFVELADQVRPSVVAIRTYKVRRAGSTVKIPYSQGSGFVIDAKGYVATNRHVIESSDAISVILSNGVDYDATIVGQDERSDLAVIKIDAAGLAAVTFGDLETVRVSQWVFACGNPFGLANDDGRSSVTFGAISALGRQMTQQLAVDSDKHYYGNMIETSATINPGNSGGPLFNVDGKVIGVVTAIETNSGANEGHGFAVPMTKNTRRIITMLKNGEAVRYGFLGVTVDDPPQVRSRIVSESRARRGARLSTISMRNGPAARAGLKANDIVVEYDGVPVNGWDHLVRMVGFTPVGTEVPLTYLRRHVKRKTVVTIGDRQEMISRANSAP